MGYYGLNYMYGFDASYILIIIAMIITLAASIYMNSTFAKYQRVNASINMTAAEAALRIMQAAGIDNVKIGRVNGNLTDHYAPTKKELNLSDSTYESRSIASIGVAAHEVGHAIQDQTKFAPLVFQLSVAPALSIVSQISVPLIFIGLLFGLMQLYRIGIIAFSATLVYQLITLPVEFDASRRAIKNLSELGILDSSELYGVKKVLTAAAMTYVAAAAATVLQLLRFMLLANRRRD